MSMKRKAVLAALLAAVSVTVLPSYAEDKAVYETYDGQGIASKTMYEYKPDSFFEVYARTGFLNDIVLRQGETVTYIAGGDTTRWKIDQATVEGRTHIYIKPIRDDIQTDLIINTTKHTYRFYVFSTKEYRYTPIIEFSYPQEEAAERAARLELRAPAESKETKEFLDIYAVRKGSSYKLKNINRRYTAQRKGKVADDLYPLEIFDDGTRTYFKMPKSNKYDMPVLYDVDENNKLTLINYRMRGQYMVADKLFEKARLVYSAKSYLEITPNNNGDRYRNPSKLDYSTKTIRDMKGDAEHAVQPA